MRNSFNSIFNYLLFVYLQLNPFFVINIIIMIYSSTCNTLGKKEL